MPSDASGTPFSGCKSWNVILVVTAIPRGVERPKIRLDTFGQAWDTFGHGHGKPSIDMMLSFDFT